MTANNVQAARDRHTLGQARAWGFVSGNPESITEAIARLRRAAQPNPTDQYRSRQDPYERQRRIDCENLARQLEEIQQRATSIIDSQENRSVKISAAFPSTYLKAADLQGRTVRVTIADCRMEHLDDETKPLLLFAGKDRGLILNKTNSGVLVAAMGDETDNWRGQVIELYQDRVMFGGKMVDAIRIRVPTPAVQPQQAPPTQAAAYAASAAHQQSAPAAESLNDDIPF